MKVVNCNSGSDADDDEEEEKPPSPSPSFSTEPSKERRYCEMDHKGRMRCRKMTTYECQLEEDVQKLQDALFTLTSHYARVQFRLRQISSASGSERLDLLRELERITCQGLDGNPGGADELPSLQCDSRSLGNVRDKQRRILSQLRGSLKNLADEANADVCFQTDECGCSDVVGGSKLRVSKTAADGTGEKGDYEDEEDKVWVMDVRGNMKAPNDKGCKCRACQRRMLNRAQKLEEMDEGNTAKSLAQRYLPEKWSVQYEENELLEPPRRRSLSRSRTKSKCMCCGSVRSSRSVGRSKIKRDCKTSFSNCTCSTVVGYPLPYFAGKKPSSRRSSMSTPLCPSTQRERTSSSIAIKCRKSSFGPKEMPPLRSCLTPGSHLKTCHGTISIPKQQNGAERCRTRSVSLQIPHGPNCQCCMGKNHMREDLKPPSHIKTDEDLDYTCKSSHEVMKRPTVVVFSQNLENDRDTCKCNKPHDS